MRKSHHKTKWNFAIGTTSIVPKTNRRSHYLIFDVDSKDCEPAFKFIRELYDGDLHKIIAQETPRGWHVFTNIILEFKELCYILRRVPGVDPAWINIGERRGYFFLADKDAIHFSWKVVRMVIHHGKR